MMVNLVASGAVALLLGVFSASLTFSTHYSSVDVAQIYVKYFKWC